jgi:hypothetical protein
MTASASDWDNPLYPAVITTDAVASGRQPILGVRHTEEGHVGWDFYDDVEPLGDPIVIPKARILELDPSMAAVKNLPIGWEAMRESPSSEWRRSRIAP